MESTAPQSVKLAYSVLTLGNVALSILLYVVLSCSYQVVYYRFFHPLSKFPGPFWAAVTRLWIAYPDLAGEERPKECLDLAKQYGPVVRITPTMVFVSSSSEIPNIYRRHANKAKTYITGSFGEPENLFNVQEWKQHAQMRKLIAGSYSMSNVRKMEPLMDIQIQDWIDKISETFASKEGTLNFSQWSKYLAYDVIGEIGFGAPFGFIKTASDVSDMIKAFEDGAPIFGILGRLYPFTIWIKKTWVGKKYLVAKPEDKSGWGAFMRLRDKLIAKRQTDLKAGTMGGRVDLLQTLLDARGEDGKPLDIDYVKAETVLVLIAGTDTTGTAVQSLVQLILGNDRVYDKVMAEVDAATKGGHLSDIPKFDEVLKHCPYYVACTKEALRLYPSAPATLARMAPPEGLVIQGVHIPGGTEVACNPWVIGRDEGLYGPDVNVFRPERWLESEEQTALYDKNNFVFGHGTRSCLGKDIAMMELYKGPLQFFRRFRLNMENEGIFAIKGGLGCWRDCQIRVAPRAPVA